MSGNQWADAAKKLSEDEKLQALEYMLEMGGSDTHCGIIRQILGNEQKPLSAKQQYIYDNQILPSLVEKCGLNGCQNFVPAGTGSCQNCSIEYNGY